MSDVTLVSMPFSPFFAPSPGIGQLASSARTGGLDTRAFYANLRFLKLIGFTTYEFLSDLIGASELVAEWVFSSAAFSGFDYPRFQDPSFFVDEDAHFNNTLFPNLGAHQEGFKSHCRNRIMEAHDLAGGFVDAMAAEILSGRPKIVGCSSSFAQNCSSLALLRRIRESDPSVVTMMGGANCEAEMGLVIKKNCPWVDYVVSGEADLIFPELCRKAIEFGPHLPLEETPPGVYSADKLAKAPGGLSALSETAIVERLDQVPSPDYSDYFTELEALELSGTITPILPLEGSRGCWKGSRQPCTFCGLNGSRMRYRTKPYKRVLMELDLLSRSHGMEWVMMTDTIMSMAYFRTLLVDLAAAGSPYKVFFEVSSNLDEKQVESLVRAGVVWVQPGIEGLHDDLLVLLNKGNTAMGNVALLKFALEYGVTLSWNLLGGVPGDQERHYLETLALLPLLHHLQPPQTVAEIRFDRFSEYWRHQDRFGLDLKPAGRYGRVFPFPEAELGMFAYFFEDQAPRFRDSALFQKIRMEIDRWQRAFYDAAKRPKLVILDAGDGLVVEDTRLCRTAPEHHLDSDEAVLYRTCRTPTGKDDLLDAVARQGRDLEEPDLEAILSSWMERKLAIHMKDRYLAIATLPGRKAPTLCRYAPRRIPMAPLGSRLLREYREERSRTELPWEWLGGIRMEGTPT